MPTVEPCLRAAVLKEQKRAQKKSTSACTVRRLLHTVGMRLNGEFCTVLTLPNGMYHKFGDLVLRAGADRLNESTSRVLSSRP